MPISGYFDVLFAASGTKTTVPDAVDPGGLVSYTQGYGPDYTLQPGTTGALNVQNYEINQLLYDITAAIQQLQQGGIPSFITSTMNGGTAYSYAQGAIVRSGGVVYQSITAANTTTPPGADWAVLDISQYLPLAGGTTTGVAILAGGAIVPLRTSNDSSNNAASTAFANPGSLLNQNGYQILPSGTIIQWGATTGVTTTGGTVGLPIAFPNNFWRACAYVETIKGGTVYSVGGHSNTANPLNSIDLTSSSNSVATVGYIAIGN